MRVAIGETERRREIQASYNEQHGIEPRTITKGVYDILIAAEAKGLYKAGKKSGREAPRDPDELRTLRSEEHTSELQSRQYLVCRLLLEKKTSACYNSIYHTHLV